MAAAQGTNTWQVQRVEQARRTKKRKVETARVLPEPKMTGSGRYVNRRRELQKRRSQAAPEMAWFSLTLLHSLIKHKRAVASNQRHRLMLDPFLALLVKCVCVCAAVKGERRVVHCTPWHVCGVADASFACTV